MGLVTLGRGYCPWGVPYGGRCAVGGSENWFSRILPFCCHLLATFVMNFFALIVKEFTLFSAQLGLGRILIFVYPRGEYFSHFHFFFFGGAPAVMPVCTFQNLDDKYVDGDDH